MGSSQSDKQVRIYDKNVESKGEVNSIRFEVQFRDDLAHYSFLMYFAHESCEPAVKEASSYALGSVDFIDRVSSVLSRCPRSAFWEDFIALVGEAVRLSVPRLQTMLSDKKRWVENQVVGTIALISRCIGYDDTLHWLQQQIREKLVARNTRADEFVQTWKDRLVVERGGFEDFFAISSW
jgi:DNA relaxase NicK